MYDPCNEQREGGREGRRRERVKGREGEVEWGSEGEGRKMMSVYKNNFLRWLLKD